MITRNVEGDVEKTNVFADASVYGFDNFDMSMSSSQASTWVVRLVEDGSSEATLV